MMVKFTYWEPVKKPRTCFESMKFEFKIKNNTNHTTNDDPAESKSCNKDLQRSNGRERMNINYILN